MLPSSDTAFMTQELRTRPVSVEVNRFTFATHDREENFFIDFLIPIRYQVQLNLRGQNGNRGKQ